MAKIILQVIPSAYTTSYQQQLEVAYKPGFNFYINGYPYIYASVVRYKNNIAYENKIKNSAGLWLENRKIARWVYIENARYIEMADEYNGVEPPDIGPRSKRWWKADYPGADNKWFAWFTKQSFEYLGFKRRPPWGITDTFYGTNSAQHLVFSGSIKDGSVSTVTGGLGSGHGQYNTPKGIFVGTKYVFVADAGNKRIVILNKSNLSYYGEINKYGIADTPFDAITDVAYDGVYVFVVDAAAQLLIRISMASPTTASTYKIFKTSYNNLQNCDYMLATYYSLYLSDNWTDRIAKFGRPGLGREYYNTEGEQAEMNLAGASGMDTDGHWIYIACKDSGEVKILQPSYNQPVATYPAMGGICDIAIAGELALCKAESSSTVTIYRLSSFAAYSSISSPYLVGCAYLSAESQQLFPTDITSKT